MSTASALRQSQPSTTQRPAPYAIDATSLGWLVVGASAVADQWSVAAIRHQPPQSASQSVNSWITGIHSHHAGRGQQFAFKHHIPRSSDDLAELLYRDAVRCVYVANHPRHHVEAVRAALLAGKHVLCEPPLALSIEDAHLLDELAQRSHLLLGVNFSHRCDPVLAELKQRLESDEIGEVIGGRILNAPLLEIRQRTWRLQPEIGGALLHRTLFDIDLIHYLFENTVDAIHAQSHTRVHTKDLDEEIQAVVRLKRNKLVLSLYDSFLLPHADSMLELFGANGSARVAHCLSPHLPADLTVFSQKSLRPAADKPPEEGPRSTPVVRFVNAFTSFNQAVRTGSQPAATVHDFIAALRVIEGARRSLQKSEWTLIE
ncbi:MAG: Gfo/Idh/MocA family oxidoreductase [Caldilineaceae bacterium]